MSALGRSRTAKKPPHAPLLAAVAQRALLEHSGLKGRRHGQGALYSVNLLYTILRAWGGLHSGRARFYIVPVLAYGTESCSLQHGVPLLCETRARVHRTELVLPVAAQQCR